MVPPFTHYVYLLRLRGSERRGFALQCFSSYTENRDHGKSSTMVAIPQLVLVFLATNVGYLQAAKESPYVIDKLEKNQRDVYTASWAVEIMEGGDKMADIIANQHGFISLGKVKLTDRCSNMSSLLFSLHRLMI